VRLLSRKQPRPLIPEYDAKLNHAIRLVKKYIPPPGSPAEGEQRADLEEAVRTVVEVSRKFGMLQDHGDVLRRLVFVCGDCQARVLAGETHDCPVLMGVKSR